MFLCNIKLVHGKVCKENKEKMGNTPVYDVNITKYVFFNDFF